MKLGPFMYQLVRANIRIQIPPVIIQITTLGTCIYLIRPIPAGMHLL